jgi:hypothetical protein
MAGSRTVATWPEYHKLQILSLFACELLRVRVELALSRKEQKTQVHYRLMNFLICICSLRKRASRRLTSSLDGFLPPTEMKQEDPGSSGISEYRRIASKREACS